MCGRYFITLAMDKKFKQRIIEHKRKNDQLNILNNDDEIILDIYPGDKSYVINQNRDTVIMEWGFNSKDNSLLINARSESASEKPLFKNHLKNERIVIPAAGFYEWDCHKNKNTIKAKKHTPLFFAGFSRKEEDGQHFIIITKTADSSLIPIHDRMPLIISKEDINTWLDGDINNQTDNLIASLLKIKPELDITIDQEQTSLF